MTQYTSSGSKLPFIVDVAKGYLALDLPYGVPMKEVTKRWKTYLKKCHPDLHRNNDDLLAIANELTRRLTQAHDTIRDAWDRHK